MRITSKGQVTIPIQIRRKVGLLPNTEVKFEVTGNMVILKKTGFPSKRGRDLVNWMRGKGTLKLTTDEILALTRG
jgi:AbrB family looped-hinge helix DNA binding protein